jgi:hypothetical protein
VVLEVEREGKWVLSEWEEIDDKRPNYKHNERLWWMSRHDALLLDRVSGDLVIDSAKTTGKMDGRKLRDAQRDMQGLSEGVDIERRLGELWRALHNNEMPDSNEMPEIKSRAMYDYLRDLPAPPRISAVRYDYTLKGERDRADSSRPSRIATATAQKTDWRWAGVTQSKLLYPWVKQGMTPADVELAHSFAFVNDQGDDKKLYWKDWNQQPVWESGPEAVAFWVDSLDKGTTQPLARQPGDLARSQDVLGDICIPPVLVQRNDDDLRDWLEQTEAQEVQTIRDAARVRATEGEAEKRTALNILFPQHRQSCSYPSECSFARVCYGGEDIRRDPLATGWFKVREPNHPQEVE